MTASTGPLRVHHRLDLGEIDAVGFDLDHTLAIYDDPAVNEIAAAAARRLLVTELGYPRALLGGGAPMEAPAAGRTLAADLAHGAVVKLGSWRDVLHGRLAGRWLGPDEIAVRFAAAVADDPLSAYTVYSPFELPVLWLLEEIEPLAPERPRSVRCEDVRRMLDVAHTNGVLKDRLRADLARFVAGVPGADGHLERWAAAGKRLFVVTNSEPGFASAVLDRAVGPAWRALFEVVVAGARKPAFFGTPAQTTGHPRMPHRRGEVIQVTSASALEAMLGLARERVLFVGDNTRSDIRAARAHGWRTAQVVPELAAVETSDAWGAPLAHQGRPTWLAHIIGEADLACDHVARLLAVGPATLLTPADGARRAEGA